MFLFWGQFVVCEGVGAKLFVFHVVDPVAVLGTVLEIAFVFVGDVFVKLGGFYLVSVAGLGLLEGDALASLF